MPDWSYRTVLRPLLDAMGPVLGRDFAIETMAIVARLPGGGLLIDLLGHMRPDPRLRTELLGLELPSPLGLGPGLDVYARALPAWQRFGFGLLEVGPVTVGEKQHRIAAERDDARSVIRLLSPTPGPPLAPLVEQLRRDGRPQTPLLIRLGIAPETNAATATHECRTMIGELRPHACGFSLATLRVAMQSAWSPEEWTEHVGIVVRESMPNPVLLCVPADRQFTESSPWIDAALGAGAKGIVCDGASALHAGFELGASAVAASRELVTSLRKHLGTGVPIIASGGVQSPRDALALYDAGADVVQVDDGLVFSGPGLPKRINEAVLARRLANSPTTTMTPTSLRVVDTAWFWSLLIGIALLIGTGIALAIAFTQVVHSYDEMLTGLTRDKIASINDRLLDFMTHDRTSLAGTMYAVGVFYCLAAWVEMRRGSHAAYVAMMSSAFSGFATFFAFLGFGYFDPFHAFVTTTLFQLQLTAVRGHLPPTLPNPVADLDDDRAWRRSQWGQLIAVVHGTALIVAGCVILTIACSFVLVQTDLDFLCTTVEQLQAADPLLMPLIAHDRAAMGGMLLAGGIMLTLTALWSFGRGRAAAWWMLAVGAVPGYLAAFIVHLRVGYDDVLHLLPVTFGLLASAATLVLSGPYLLAKPQPRDASSA